MQNAADPKHLLPDLDILLEHLRPPLSELVPLIQLLQRNLPLCDVDLAPEQYLIALIFLFYIIPIKQLNIINFLDLG